MPYMAIGKTWWLLFEILNAHMSQLCKKIQHNLQARAIGLCNFFRCSHYMEPNAIAH